MKSAKAEKMICSKKETIVSAVNCLIIATVGIVILLINRLWVPFQRGFFCDDESIQYPHHNSTISSPVMYGVGFSLNIISFMLVEPLILRRYKTRWLPSDGKQGLQQGRNLFQVYFCAVFKILLPFLYGAAVVQLVTDIAKYSVGRLRPHFLDVCKPDYNKFNCTDGYITADVCTGDQALIKHARVSFPSGHSSFSMYTMLFLVFYYQARLTFKDFLLLRPLLQLIVFCLAYYTGLSRIYDYKHHWSDVFGGFAIGIVVALIAVFVWTDLFKRQSSLQTECNEKSRGDSEQLDTVKVPVTQL